MEGATQQAPQAGRHSKGGPDTGDVSVMLEPYRKTSIGASRRTVSLDLGTAGVYQ